MCVAGLGTAVKPPAIACAPPCRTAPCFAVQSCSKDDLFAPLVLEHMRVHVHTRDHVGTGTPAAPSSSHATSSLCRAASRCYALMPGTKASLFSALAKPYGPLSCTMPRVGQVLHHLAVGELLSIRHSLGAFRQTPVDTLQKTPVGISSYTLGHITL
jgi:hypothetical protein